MPPALPPGPLIGVVLAVIGIEVLVLVLFLALGRRPALMRQMLPGASAGLFLALALNALSQGGPWLPLWLMLAGAAHATDWWQRLRRTAR